MSHSVSLTWTASSDAVDGYNVYEGSTTGSETRKVNTAVVTGTSFIDASPSLGNNFYIARSIKNGVESVNSNEVNAVILPAPPTQLIVTASS